jgi:hypothetical protein
VLRLIKLGAPAENVAAEALKDLILRAWPDVETDPSCDIRIITGVYLTGQKVDDLDIVMRAVFERPREVALVNNERAVVRSYLLGSLCAVIEVKGHRCDSAEIRGGALWVSYKGEQKNVTKQNRDQMHALAEFLAAAGAGRPHVTRFIWLGNVTAAELRQFSVNGDLPHEIILKDSTWENILFSIWRAWRGRHPEARGFAADRYFISADLNRSNSADFNRISQLLTNEEMRLQPFTFADLPELRPAPPRNAHPTGQRRQRVRRLSQSEYIGRVIAGGFVIVAVGVAIAVYAPRLMLRNQPQAVSSQTKGGLASYTGSYRCSSSSETYSITEHANQLQLSSRTGSSDLASTATDEFRTGAGKANVFKGTLRFSRTSDGKISGMVLLPARGTKITCTRME